MAERARALNRIADRIEEYLPFLAAVETYDNGKPIRETNLADLPLAVRPFPVLRQLRAGPGRFTR